MTAELDAPANPICLACIATPLAGADVNVSAWLTIEYDLVVDASLGCCVTPSSVTKTSWLEGTSFERLNKEIIEIVEKKYKSLNLDINNKKKS